MKISKILASSTDNKSSTQQPKKVPRPLNCFMTFRMERQREIMKKFPGANHRDISKTIAKWWKELSAEEKEPYKRKAEIAKLQHRLLYPDYKYSPKKKATKKRTYNMRPESQYTMQDIESKRQLLSLPNDRNISNNSSNGSSSKSNEDDVNFFDTFRKKLATSDSLDNVALNQTGDDGQDNICCALCLSSNRSCFTTDNEQAVSMTTLLSSSSSSHPHLMRLNENNGFSPIASGSILATGGLLLGGPAQNTSISERNVYYPSSTSSSTYLDALFSIASQDNISTVEPIYVELPLMKIRDSVNILDHQNDNRSLSPPSSIIDKASSTEMQGYIDSSLLFVSSGNYGNAIIPYISSTPDLSLYS